MKSVHEDRALFSVPSMYVANAMAASFKAGKVCHPCGDATRDMAGITKGQGYIIDGTVLTCEEIRWGLTRGYIRSELHGDTCVEVSSKLGEEVVKWDEPRVRYVVTQKGLNSIRWY